MKSILKTSKTIVQWYFHKANKENNSKPIHCRIHVNIIFLEKEETPAKKKRSDPSSDMVSYFREKNENKATLKEKELRVREKELEIEKKKIELEVKKHDLGEKRLELDSKRHADMMGVLFQLVKNK